MQQVLRKSCRFVKTTFTSEAQLSFYAQCKLTNEKMLNVVKVGIAEKLGGAKYDLPPSAEGQIVVVFE